MLGGKTARNTCVRTTGLTRLEEISALTGVKRNLAQVELCLSGVLTARQCLLLVVVEDIGGKEDTGG